MKERFSYLHTTLVLAFTILIEGILLWIFSQTVYDINESLVLFFAFAGVFTIIILCTEVIHEYKEDFQVLFMLMLTILQFIGFFAFQYWFLMIISPTSYTGFSLTIIDFIYQSTLIFLFNPNINPENDFAKILTLLNLFGSISVVMFTLQNIWHFQNNRKQTL